MESGTLDVAVVGAGVIGLAIAARLAREGREVVVLEAGDAIGTGTSSRNSEVVHAGIYYPAGSLKARLCVAGKALLYDWCDSHGVEARKVGKLIVATDDAEAERLLSLHAAAQANGVTLELLDGHQARAMEPALSCTAALWSPTTGIVDSHGLMLSLQGAAEDHGAMVAFQSPVMAGSADPDGVEIDVGGDMPMRLTCRTVVNCAGLGAQGVATAIEGVRNTPPLHLCKGSYFDLTTRPPFSRLVYPVPAGAGLGVHYTVDLAGRGRFGPDVEWLPDGPPNAIDYAVDATRGDGFQDAIRRYWPGLPDGALAPAYAGVRPKIQAPGEPSADFLIHTPVETGVEGFFTLYGIESPGLTAALAVADHIAELIAEPS